MSLTVAISFHFRKHMHPSILDLHFQTEFHFLLKKETKS